MRRPPQDPESMLSRLPQLVLAAGLALALASVSACSDCMARPLPWQDSAPSARMYLQLPFDSPVPVARGTFQAQVDVLNANSTIQASSPSLLVDIHVETAQVSTMVRYGLAGWAELQLVIPVVVASGGFLDGAIDSVESMFHASNPQRARIDRYAVRIDVARTTASPDRVETTLRPDGRRLHTSTSTSPAARLDITRSGVGFGDVWGGAKLLLFPQDGLLPAVAVRGAVKLPTGQAPYGSGEVNVGASLLAGWQFRPFGIWLQVDGAVPTGGFPELGIGSRPYGTVQVGTAWEFLEGITLRAQASAHTSPIGGTGLEQLDASTFYVLFGSTVELTRSLVLSAGFAENVFSPGRGADFTVLLGMQGRL